MKQITIICTFALFISFKNTATGSHIIGGEMSYECIDHGQYKIKMFLYRDCQSINIGMSSPFDNPAYFTIFRGDGSLYSINGQSSISVNYNLSTVETVPNVHYNPCMILPTNVCVDRATYEFTLNLPVDTLGYFITYERCCRDNNIINIKNSGTSGMTLSTFLSYEAQQVCNNSPIFSSKPPIVICSTDSVQIDYSATDLDGDSLVYSLCAAHTGASPINPAPTVGTPPPFSSVYYETGYSATQPLGGTLSMNPQTGLLTGLTNTQGKYIITVCVDEYRNGIWLSSIKRDFKFTVTNCLVSLTADIQKDDINTNQEAVIYNCGTVVQFINHSSFAQYIDEYLWSFDIGNNQFLHSTQTNPLVTFPSNGTYSGKLFVNSISHFCEDSIAILVHIIEDSLSVDFDYQYDSTQIDAVQFINTTNSSTITKSMWNFGDYHFTQELNPIHQYADSGTYQVYLMVFDSISCGYSSKEVEYYPIPILLSSPAIVLFENIQLQPNPARDETVLIFDNKKDLSEIDLEMYNTIGQLIFTKKIPLHSGENRIPINIQHLENGMYWLILKNKNQIQTLKLLKSNL